MPLVGRPQSAGGVQGGDAVEGSSEDLGPCFVARHVADGREDVDQGVGGVRGAEGQAVDPRQTTSVGSPPLIRMSSS